MDGFAGQNERLVLIGNDVVQQLSPQVKAHRPDDERIERTERLDAATLEWEAFVRELREAGIQRWRRHHHDGRLSFGVRWRISMRWREAGFSVDVSGENAYPVGFEQVATAIARLIGDLPAFGPGRAAHVPA